MWPSPSPRFQRAIRGSHKVAVHLELLQAGQPTGVDLDPFFEGGRVLVAREPVRRTAQVTLVDPSGALLPAQASDVLAPVAGRELRIWRGIDHADGGPAELVPVATVVLTGAAHDDTGARITLRGKDRAFLAQQARFETATRVPVGQNYVDAIAELLRGGLPAWVPLQEFTSTVETTPLMVLDAGSDRWETCQQMALVLGQQLHFDPMGRLRMAPEPNPATDPPAAYLGEATATHPDGPLHSLAGDLDAEDAVSVVVARGESTSATAAPVSATVQDDDPASPTYVGTFGRRVMIHTSTTLTTAAHCEVAARSLLQRHAGLDQQLDLEVLADPRLGLDVVEVARARAKASGLRVVDRIELGLTSATMRVSTRAVRTV